MEEETLVCELDGSECVKVGERYFAFCLGDMVTVTLAHSLSDPQVEVAGWCLLCCDLNLGPEREGNLLGVEHTMYGCGRRDKTRGIWHMSRATVVAVLSPIRPPSFILVRSDRHLNHRSNPLFSMGLPSLPNPWALWAYPLLFHFIYYYSRTPMNITMDKSIYTISHRLSHCFSIFFIIILKLP